MALPLLPGVRTVKRPAELSDLNIRLHAAAFKLHLVHKKGEKKLCISSSSRQKKKKKKSYLKSNKKNKLRRGDYSVDQIFSNREAQMMHFSI